jgi:hypothetical protein
MCYGRLRTTEALGRAGSPTGCPGEGLKGARPIMKARDHALGAGFPAG